MQVRDRTAQKPTFERIIIKPEAVEPLNKLLNSLKRRNFPVHMDRFVDSQKKNPQNIIIGMHNFTDSDAPALGIWIENEGVCEKIKTSYRILQKPDKSKRVAFLNLQIQYFIKKVTPKTPHVEDKNPFSDFFKSLKRCAALFLP